MREHKDWEEEFKERFVRTEYNPNVTAIIVKDIIKFLRQKEQEKVERIKEQVQQDLDSGRFYRICSNESTFKEYIFNLIQ